MVTILAAGAVGVVAFRGSVAGASAHDAVPDRPPHRGRSGTLLRRLARRLCPLAADRAALAALALASSFYRAGALVFGGGHVVLPLLNDAVVETGWVSQQAFLAGYGASQAVPGPLFTFSAYLGAIEEPSPNGIAGAAIALVSDLPAVVPAPRRGPAALVRRAGAGEPCRLRSPGSARPSSGSSAAALWDPVLRTSVHGVGDVVFAAVLFGLLRILPPWAVVGDRGGGGSDRLLIVRERLAPRYPFSRRARRQASCA